MFLRNKKNLKWKILKERKKIGFKEKYFEKCKYFKFLLDTLEKLKKIFCNSFVSEHSYHFFFILRKKKLEGIVKRSI